MLTLRPLKHTLTPNTNQLMRQSSTGTASASSQSSLEGDYETNLEIEAIEAEPPVQVNTLLPTNEKTKTKVSDPTLLQFILTYFIGFELCFSNVVSLRMKRFDLKSPPFIRLFVQLRATTPQYFMDVLNLLIYIFCFHYRLTSNHSGSPRTSCSLILW